MTRHDDRLLTTTIRTVGDGPCLLELSGEIDLAVAGQLRESFDLLIAHFAGDVVVDASELTFCDALGVGIVADAHARAEQQGRRLVIHNPRPAMRKLLRLTGATHLLDPDGNGASTGHADLSGRP